MESIKSYFEIVFKVFIWLSLVFISFKLLLIIAELKKGKKKKIIKNYSNNSNKIGMRNIEQKSEIDKDMYIGEVKKSKPEGDG
ncbi:MAG: hypothetical protein ACRDB0_02045, partial [Paraclostridium sp.]